MIKKINILALVLTLFLTSCSSFNFTSIEESKRLPASDTKEISFYLSIDKFKYYINEYSVALEGKVSDEIIAHLRSLSIQDVLNMKLSPNDLADAQNYDEIIYKYLKTKNLLGSTKKEDLKWNYNFFRNKLNEAFTLTPSKLDIALSSTGGEKAVEREIPVEKALYEVDEMTLDSGHYISNRTTRAIFWEAIESDRTVEFHLGDSREFLKTLKAQGGEILFEVRPLAKNYNKIFIVQYPGETNYRYAITNIGGFDRLNHLTNQLSLSNLSGGALKTKVVVKGDLAKFHDARAQEHIMQLTHLPKADRVIIGQKESIDGKFYLFWKMRALRTLYDEEPDLFKNIDTKLWDKFLKLEESSFESIFKDKKVVEDIYANFETYFTENPEKLPGKFKIYNFDNFTIEMCDYIFKNKDGSNIRWRVISNVWGDEVVPIARALKATGHTNVTYMGTAGAFADKGYKVGDLVIPNAVHTGKKALGVKANWMKIEGAKYGGTVEHVGSPFEETTAWLAKARARSEFVEVETSYLREIFNGPTDNVEMYLLISDILGSDTETLAHATSSKRKNSQNRLLAELFKRDALHIPTPVVDLLFSPEEKLRNLIDKVLAKKGVGYRYLIFSKLRDKSGVDEEMILKVAQEEAAFSDSFEISQLVKAGEALTEYKKAYGTDFDIAFSSKIVDGSWNPKKDKIKIVLLIKDAKDLPKMKEFDKKFKLANPDFQKSMDVVIETSVDEPGLARTKLPERIDPDIILKIFTASGFRNEGIYKSVTYNGNVTFDVLPTSKFGHFTDLFTYTLPTNSQHLGIAKPATTGGLKFTPTGNCSDAMTDFLKMIH
jgi:hypothetical protein